MHPLVGALRGSSYTLGMSAMAMARTAVGADDDVVRTMTKEWALGMCERLAIDVRVHDVGAVDWNVPHVVMANHQSYLDILALYRALPTCFGMVAKRELFFVPFFRGVMLALGCVSIDRNKGSSAHRSLQEAAERVRGGSTIVVFPEGTRSMGDRIQPLKKGPFHLVTQAGAPIVPVGIRGSARLMSREGFGITSGVIEVHVGAPIPVEGSGGAARAALMGRVREELSRLAAVPMIGGEPRAERAAGARSEPPARASSPPA